MLNKIILLIIIIFFFVNAIFAENDNNDIKNLPMIELIGDNTRNFYIIFFSGDGGWAKIDRELSGYLNKQGISIIGLDIQKYFSSRKNPNITASDLEKIIYFYNKKLNKTKVILIGFSFGADILPAVINLIKNEIRNKIIGVIFLSLGKFAYFEFKFSNWLYEDKNRIKYPVIDELKKINYINTLFIAGEKDNESIIQSLDKNSYNTLILAGDHHFNGNYSYVSKLVYEWILQISK